MPESSNHDVADLCRELCETGDPEPKRVIEIVRSVTRDLESLASWATGLAADQDRDQIIASAVLLLTTFAMREVGVRPLPLPTLPIARGGSA